MWLIIIKGRGKSFAAGCIADVSDGRVMDDFEFGDIDNLLRERVKIEQNYKSCIIVLASNDQETISTIKSLLGKVTSWPIVTMGVHYNA